jgi:GT2 family glycosyltransferase
MGAVVSGIRLRRERGLPRTVMAKLPCAEFVEGWCFAVAREEFERVGGFDPAMRVYWSDTDLMCRLVLAAGGAQDAMWVNGELPVRHLGHRTARRLAERRRLWREDRGAFIRKWSVRRGA